MSVEMYNKMLLNAFRGMMIFFVLFRKIFVWCCWMVFVEICTIVVECFWVAGGCCFMQIALFS